MKIKYLFRYYFLLCASLVVLVDLKANPYSDTIKINAKVPEHFWEISINILNNFGEEQVQKLSDYRGKSIILDFLSTGCISCIAALPHIERERDKFKDDLIVFPVTKQGAQDVKIFYERNKLIAGLGFSFVVSDYMLHEMFPHRYISHLVWIDQHGIVRAITGTSMVSERTIQDFMRNGPLDWPLKAEHTDFFNLPLVELNNVSNQFGNNKYRSANYSALTGFTEGVSGYMSTVDSAKRTQIVSYRNRSILDLYLYSVDRTYKLKPKQILLEVQSPDRFVYWKEHCSNTPYEEWKRQNAISYEASFPLTMPILARNEQMRKDLNRYLGLNGRIELRRLECLVLIRTDRTIHLEYKGAHKENSLTGGAQQSGSRRLSGFSLEYLVRSLDEEQFGYPLVLDETHFTQNVDLRFEIEDLGDLEGLRKSLKKYGLDLVKKMTEIEVLLITEQH